MIPTQDRIGYYWTTNDDAALPFNEAGVAQPTHVRCFNMQDNLNSGAERRVPVSDLALMAVGTFGVGRPCPGLSTTTKWTGSSHKYGIYRNTSGLYKDSIVILECHGGGMVGYAIDSITAGGTWSHIATSAPEMDLEYVQSPGRRKYGRS
jgi:hypothetical protein